MWHPQQQMRHLEDVDRHLYPDTIHHQTHKHEKHHAEMLCVHTIGQAE